MTAAGDARAAERRIVLGYVPAKSRAAFAALLALDDVLARVVRTTREPIVGQMRLTWWHEALTTLGTGPVPAEPVLAALTADVLPRGVTGGALATMIEGWEMLLDGDALDDAALSAYAASRGGALFAAMDGILEGPGLLSVTIAGEGWALADLALHLSDSLLAAKVRAMAAGRLMAAFDHPWPPALRPLGMLALLAREDIGDGGRRPGSPRRLFRLLMHRIWGR